jgi:hypothetical protein
MPVAPSRRAPSLQFDMTLVQTEWLALEDLIESIKRINPVLPVLLIN